MEKIYIDTLGCPKNTVDSENMIFLLKDAGYNITDDASEADVVVINTCSFINDAKEESINTILAAGELKKETDCKIIVSGCLAQRYLEDLKIEIPEVDAYIGTGKFYDIVSVVERVVNKEKVFDISDINCPVKEINRVISTPKYYAYIKLSEGCNKHCTYCIIPSIRGKQRSRKIEDIVFEANELAKSGVKELILIAQDVGEYGIDIYGERKLTELLKQLVKIEDLHWIRIMYVYPETITDELITVIKNEEKIVKYIDIPFQHVNNNILKRMARKTSKEEIISLIEILRREIADVRLRTSFITGFPGESDVEYKEMISFLKEYPIDKAGFFPYSREEGTPAAEYDNQVLEEIKQERFNALMETQQEVSEKLMEKLLDKEIEVLIEEIIEDGVYVGRSSYDAPEIDGVVYVYSDEELKIGEFYKVLVNDSMEYDVIGRKIK